MANALEVKTMNTSVVTPKAAGIESIAKITSVVSIAMSATSSGVAASLPARPGEEPHAIVVLGDRHDLAQAAQHEPAARADCGPPRAIRMAATSRIAPKM